MVCLVLALVIWALLRPQSPSSIRLRFLHFTNGVAGNGLALFSLENQLNESMICTAGRYEVASQTNASRPKNYGYSIESDRREFPAHSTNLLILACPGNGGSYRLALSCLPTSSTNSVRLRCYRKLASWLPHLFSTYGRGSGCVYIRSEAFDLDGKLITLGNIKASRFRGKVAIPLLKQHLESPDKDIALEAAEVLLSIEPHHVPALICRMHHAPLSIRTGAYWLLTREEVATAVAVREFMRGLTDPEPEIRQVAAESLSKYGTNAARALPLVTNLLSDPKGYVRRAATNAIASIVPPDEEADFKKVRSEAESTRRRGT